MITFMSGQEEILTNLKDALHNDRMIMKKAALIIMQTVVGPNWKGFDLDEALAIDKEKEACNEKIEALKKEWKNNFQSFVTFLPQLIEGFSSFVEKSQRELLERISEAQVKFQKELAKAKGKTKGRLKRPTELRTINGKIQGFKKACKSAASMKIPMLVAVRGCKELDLEERNFAKIRGCMSALLDLEKEWRSWSLKYAEMESLIKAVEDRNDPEPRVCMSSANDATPKKASPQKDLPDELSARNDTTNKANHQINQRDKMVSSDTTSKESNRLIDLADEMTAKSAASKKSSHHMDLPHEITTRDASLKNNIDDNNFIKNNDNNNDNDILPPQLPTVRALLNEFHNSVIDV